MVYGTHARVRDFDKTRSGRRDEFGWEMFVRQVVATRTQIWVPLSNLPLSTGAVF